FPSIFLYVLPPAACSCRFPYTTLFRSGNVAFEISAWSSQYRQISIRPALLIQCPDEATSDRVAEAAGSKVTRLTSTMLELQDTKDRKSTRLNSSHVSISYAVFCLKKKN